MIIPGGGLTQATDSREESATRLKGDLECELSIGGDSAPRQDLSESARRELRKELDIR